MGAALSRDVVMPPDSVCLSALFLVRPGAVAQMHQYFITLAILIFVPPLNLNIEEIFSSFQYHQL